MNKARYKKALYPVREIRDLRELIDGSTELFGEKPAFLVKDEPGGEYRPILYTEFRREIDNFGTALLHRKLKGEKIAIIGENSYEWVLSYFAVSCGVGIFVPIERELPTADMKSLLERSGAGVVIFSEKASEQVAEATKGNKKIVKINMNAREDLDDVLSMKKLLEEGAGLLAEGHKEYSSVTIDPAVMSLLLFTSGTTGASKGVMLCQKNLVANVMNMSKFVNVEGMTGLSVLPMHHTYEMTCHILTALYQGCTIAICEGLKHIAENMIEAEVNVMLGVPLIFEGMYKKIWKKAEKSGRVAKLRKAVNLSKSLGLENTGLPAKMFKDIHAAVGGHVKLLISGAAAMDPGIIEDFRAMGLPMIQGYGMTECSPIIAVNRDRYSKAASVGPPMPGTEVRIIDKDEYGIGEIICKSDSVMLGYYEDPEETAKVLKEGWLYTGDYGFMDDEGFLYITGRKKNVIVTKNGKNIFPEELEFHLGKSEYILESLVYGVDEQCGGETVVHANIVPNYEAIEEDFGKLSDQEIHKLIKEAVEEANSRMTSYKRIKRFEIRKTEFEKTASRKIKRNKENRQGGKGNES